MLGLLAMSPLQGSSILANRFSKVDLPGRHWDDTGVLIKVKAHGKIHHGNGNKSKNNYIVTTLWYMFPSNSGVCGDSFSLCFEILGVWKDLLQLGQRCQPS